MWILAGFALEFASTAPAAASSKLAKPDRMRFCIFVSFNWPAGAAEPVLLPSSTSTAPATSATTKSNAPRRFVKRGTRFITLSPSGRQTRRRRCPVVIERTPRAAPRTCADHANAAHDLNLHLTQAPREKVRGAVRGLRRALLSAQAGGQSIGGMRSTARWPPEPIARTRRPLHRTDTGKLAKNAPRAELRTRTWAGPELTLTISRARIRSPAPRAAPA